MPVSTPHIHPSYLTDRYYGLTGWCRLVKKTSTVT